MTVEDEANFKNKNICRFCDKDISIDKVSDHCHLTGKYKEPAHNNCYINFTQRQSSFIPLVFHNFSNYGCHLFFKQLFDEKNDKVKFKSVLITNEEYVTTTTGCKRYIDNYHFLSKGLNELVKNLDNVDFKNFKKNNCLIDGNILIKN